MLRTIHATRYVMPLREGGSLPAIIGGDDLGFHVLKFRGAGQGTKALVAEIVGGELARAFGLKVPETVLAELDVVLGRNEPHDEIRDLLQKSVMNVDRTPKNPNLLTWHGGLWLIDHGAAPYFHHAWANAATAARSPFKAIKDHVLLPFASELSTAAEALQERLSADLIRSIVAFVPDAFLLPDDTHPTPEAQRDAYAQVLIERLEAAPVFVEEAARARSLLV